MTQTIISMLGTSRCGSTLLQSNLASVSNAIPLGEISRTRDLLERQTQCACGVKLDDCSFWAPALGALKRVAPIAAWSKSSWGERIDALRGAFAAVTGLGFLASSRERQSAVALQRALTLLTPETGNALFIDTSKDPSEFLRLTLFPSCSLVPVHLVRDPRAVAWSGFRRTGTDPLVMALHWARLNRAIALLRRLTPRYPWQVVRYEDFCSDPSSVSQNLLAAAGGRAGNGRATPNHAMGGSPGFSFSASQGIVPDERWKADMPQALQQRIIERIGNTARKFGYS